MNYCTMERCLGNLFLENVVTDYKYLKDIFKLDILWCFSKCGKEEAYKEEDGTLTNKITDMAPVWFGHVHCMLLSP